MEIQCKCCELFCIVSIFGSLHYGNAVLYHYKDAVCMRDDKVAFY